jgi:hypothetical protein
MSYRPATVGRVGPLITLFSNLVLSLPTLAVLVVGLVLVSGRGRLPARSAVLARSGLLLMVLREVLSLTWSVLFPHLLLRRGYGDGTLNIRTIGYLNAGISFALGAVFAVGLALLIAGLVTGRRTPDRPAHDHPAPNAAPYPAPYPAPDAAPYGAPGPSGVFPAVPVQSADVRPSGVFPAVAIQPAGLHPGGIAAGETGRIIPDAQDPWSGDHRAQ